MGPPLHLSIPPIPMAVLDLESPLLSEKTSHFHRLGDSVRRRSRKELSLLAASVFCVLALLYSVRTLYSGDYVQRTLANYAASSQSTHYLRDATRPGRIVPAPPSRLADLQDAFANYSQTPDCSISSLELHEPFHPLCPTKKEMLRALTDGGRIGMDAPYTPRGCDFRWFTVQELCGILSNFETVHIIGDSMMRNLAVGMNTLLRADLVKGPHLDYVPDPEGYDCQCMGAFNGPKGGKCLFNSAYSSELVWGKDAGVPIRCPKAETGGVEFSPQTKYPLDSDQLTELVHTMPDQSVPLKPHAFVLGHGLWNDINITASKLWLDQVQETVLKRMPYLKNTPHEFSRLFITPSASGASKPTQFELTQGNARLIQFEREMGQWVSERGMDHLGTWNLTVQNTSPDGTHAGMRSNLVKAMMVYNWLARIADGDIANQKIVELEDLEAEVNTSLSVMVP